MNESYCPAAVILLCMFLIYVRPISCSSGCYLEIPEEVEKNSEPDITPLFLSMDFFLIDWKEVADSGDSFHLEAE